MGTLADAYIRIRPDTKGLDADGLKKPAQQMGRTAGAEAGKHFGLSFKSLALAGVTAATALAGSQVVGFFKKTITLASDVSESQNKVAVVFGKSTKAVVDFGKNSASSMGLSKASYLAAAGTLGNLFVALKLPQAEAAKMSTKMIKLASDMASFNNVSPEEALAALQSGLVGETEPLRKFGVNLNEATIKAQAMKMGIISSTKEALTPAQKATATYALILAQTGTAQNDFGRTSTGLANQQRILKAKVDDLKTSLGEKLLPTVTRLVNWLTTKGVPAVEGFIKGMKDGTGWGGRFADVITGVGKAAQSSWTFVQNHKTAILALVAAFTTATAAVKAFNVVLGIMDVLMSANPISLIIIATVASIAAWIAIIVVAYNKMTWFHDGVNVAWRSISTGATNMNRAVKPELEAIGKASSDMYTQHIQPAAVQIRAAWNTIAASAKTAWETIIRPALLALQNFIRTNVAPTVLWLANNVFKPAFQVIQIAVSVAWASLKVIFGLIQIAIKLVGSVLLAFYTSTWRPIWNAASTLVSVMWTTKVKPILSAFASYFHAFLEPAMLGFGRVAKSVWDGIANAAKTPIRFVVVTVLNNGLLAAYNKLADTFKVNPRNVRIPLPSGFALGGPVGRGRGTRDDVPAMLTRGEHVLTTDEVSAMGGHDRIQRMRRMALEGRRPFRDGGPVGQGPDWLRREPHGDFDPIGWAKSAIKALDPVSAFKGLVGKFDNLSGGGFGQVAGAAGKTIVNGVVNWVKDKFLGGGNAGKGTWAAKSSGWPGPYGNSPPWAANTAGAAAMIRSKFPGQSAGSYVSPHGWSDHFPKAIDAMTNAGTAGGLARGNAMINAYVANAGKFGLKYLIWNRRFTEGHGWVPYTGTSNPHTDHVHASFYGRGGRVHGMANGGLINEPIWGVGKSGRRYMFGERGPETVTPGVGGGVNMVFNVSGDLDTAAAERIRAHVSAEFARLSTGLTKGRRR